MRYLKAIGLGFTVWVVSFPVFLLVSFSVNSLIYPALTEWFPRVFSIPNFVKDREGYEALYNLLGFISGVITVLTASYLSVRFDNERMEYMVAETEGMYSFREGMSLYYPRYRSADIAASFIIPLPLLLTDLFIIPLLDFLPYGVKELIDFLFLSTRAFTDYGGIIFGYILAVLIFLAARMLSGLRSIDAYRAFWLSDVEYAG